MARIILHSDDFGLHPAINRAVFDAAGQGVLTSASLMANGLAAADAIAKTSQLERLGVGLHLNIVRGRPLSDPAQIPSLVNSTGRFYNSAGTLLMRSVLGRLSTEEIYIEYRRQVEFMLDHGIEPTHFDGEKHTHLLLPEASRALGRLMEEFNIRKVRLINETGVLQELKAAGISVPGNWQQHLKLGLLEYRAKKVKTIWRQVKHSGQFFGVLMSGNIAYPQALEVLKAFLQKKGDTVVEWMFHIGYPFNMDEAEFREEFGSYFLSDTRGKELEFLLKDEVVMLLKQYRDQLISYREL